ncbi:MAG TPA: DUF58 domain-containing protein [Thermoanaerobaculia bacterium]
MSLREAIAHGERIGAGYALVAPRTIASGGGGARVSRRAGGSLEFRDHRDYHPGDDLRHVDWNVVARSDRLIVKQFHEEVSPVVDLIVDGSRSMALADSRKSHATMAVASLLATAARNAGFPYTLSIARERLQILARGATRPTQWDDVAFDFAGSPASALISGGAILRPLGIRILISDLLWEGEPRAVLSALAQNASALIVVQLLAESEETPDLRGGWRLVDVESGEWREIVFDAAAAARYRDALARHRALWDDAARHAKALVVRGVAERIEERLVFDELVSAEILKAS